MAALAAATAALLLTGTLTAPAGADAPSRVTLPDPNLGPAPSGGTASPANPQLTMPLRVYLSGPNPQAEAAAALAVSDPRGPAYAHYLTPNRYQQAFGPSAAQVSTVSSWLTSEGMTITATNQHYITVTATVAQVDAALDTQITAYTRTIPATGKTITTYADAGGFSVPAALGNDITTITGFVQWAQLNGSGGIGLSTARTSTTPASADRATAVTEPADATSGFQCSQYWGQHTTPIPAAFGHTSAPTELCGYTVSQLRSAYGISSSPYTGKGATIAVVLTATRRPCWPTPTSSSSARACPASRPASTPRTSAVTTNRPARLAPAATTSRTSRRRRLTWRPRTSPRRTRTWSTWAATAQGTWSRTSWTR
jgi:hypothetical protein